MRDSGGQHWEQCGEQGRDSRDSRGIAQGQYRGQGRDSEGQQGDGEDGVPTAVTDSGMNTPEMTLLHSESRKEIERQS